MTIQFYSKGIPFWVKAGHFYFFITCVLALILMKMKLGIMKEIDCCQNPQLFSSLDSFISYCTKFGKDSIAQLRVFFELDFVFMFGYTGWFVFFVFLINKIRKQPKWINFILFSLIIITLLTDVYENLILLISMCSYEEFSKIHTTFCKCSSGKDYFNWYYSFNYNLKYTAALAFIVLYVIIYIKARKEVKNLIPN